jgi:hypothetical protein
MLASLLASAVLCTVELEADDTYFALCKGRRELMEAQIQSILKKDKMGVFCTVYTYTEWKEGYQSFVAVCE